MTLIVLWILYVFLRKRKPEFRPNNIRERGIYTGSDFMLHILYRVRVCVNIWIPGVNLSYNLYLYNVFLDFINLVYL